jgi:hypothetical protein
MAMKFKVEKKGQSFLVVNETTGYVKGRFKEEGEAKVLRDRLQDAHNEEVGLIESTSRAAEEPEEDK